MPGHGTGNGHQSRRPDPPSNGYETDSSQDSRERSNSGHSSRSSRPWKPMREVLNVDSVLRGNGGSSGDQDRRQHSPRRRPGGQSPSRKRDQERRGQDRDPDRDRERDRREPKSLMTIYEDEQRHEDAVGSRSSLESDSRGGLSDREGQRSKGSTAAALKVRNDTWKIQRTESGYESSDRLSNGSANLDSPIVENPPIKELRTIPEQHLNSETFPPRRRDDPMMADVMHPPFPYGEQPMTSPDDQDPNLVSSAFLKRRRAFRFTPGALEKNAALDSDQEDNVDGSPTSSPVPPYLAKTSSSEWNSSEDLAGPFSEQEDPPPRELPYLHDYPPLPLPPPPPGPPATPKAFDHWSADGDRAKKNGLSALARRWIETPAEHRLSSDASSKSGSSDQDRDRDLDLSASESEERFSEGRHPRRPGDDREREEDLQPDRSPVRTKVGVPTTYFSVDGCMTDTYRAKYHKRPALVAITTSTTTTTDPRREEAASSGESDVEGKRFPATEVRPQETPKGRSEPGYFTSKTTARWNPVTPKGLDEHGFL